MLEKTVLQQLQEIFPMEEIVSKLTQEKRFDYEMMNKK